MSAIAGTKLEIPVFLASWFGLRRGEICGQRWQDIDLENMVLSVNGVVTGKGKKSQTENLTFRANAKTISSIRSFRIPEKVKEFIGAVKIQQKEERELAGNSYN